jgi:hypothetical protein
MIPQRRALLAGTLALRPWIVAAELTRVPLAA